MAIIIDRGAELMLGNYYNTQALCFDESNCDKTGNVIAGLLDRRKEVICRQIVNDLRENGFNEMFGVDVDACAGDCFVKSKVEYNDDFRYVKFPYFKIRGLEEFELGLDVNPCIGKGGRCTKIYSIFRYYREFNDAGTVHSFFKKAIKLCESIAASVAVHYFEVLKSLFPGIDINPGEPFSLSSIGLGSTDPFVGAYIDKSGDSAQFRAFCMNVSEAKAITKYLSSACTAINKKSLSEYLWSKNVYIYPSTARAPREREIPSETREISAYVGYAENNDKGCFIALSSGDPKDVLRPLNIECINKC